MQIRERRFPTISAQVIDWSDSSDESGPTQEEADAPAKVRSQVFFGSTFAIQGEILDQTPPQAYGLAMTAISA